MRKFEYLSLQISRYKNVVHRGSNPSEIVGSTIPELLASFGDEGWELVSVIRIEADPSVFVDAYSLYTFKRPKVDTHAKRPFTP